MAAKEIGDVQRFARKHGLPVPYAFIACGEGGVRLNGNVKVVEVKAAKKPVRDGR